MLLMRRNSLCHTLTYSHIVLSILILFLWMGNVESAPLYMTNQNRAKSGVYFILFFLSPVVAFISLSPPFLGFAVFWRERKSAIPICGLDAESLSSRPRAIDPQPRSNQLQNSVLTVSHLCSLNETATDLIKKTKVEAIVGAQSLLEAKLLAAVSEKAKVPVVSALAPSSLSLKKYNHFLQLTHDSTSEAKGISRLIHDFNWESIVVIYEEGVDDWREGLQILLEHFQDDGIHIGRTVSFAESGEDYTVMNQLRKLIKSSRSAVFVVHMSETLVSRLFRCAEKLGMMEGGYAWILTARTMNKFYHSDHRSMQGVIGFRSYIPESEELTNYTSRLKKLMVGDDYENAKMETKLTSVCAHDIAFILAKSIEKIGRLRESSHLSPSDLLEEIKKSIFKGLSHADIGHKFLSGSGIFEIVNMVGTGERRIGLWSCDHFVGRRNIMASSVNELETIIWPGGSSRIPGHRFLAENGGRKRLRVLVTSINRFPHLVAVRHDPETGFSTVTGFSIEVFKTCIASFNYELEFIPYDGDNYDKRAFELSTQRDKYDAAVGDISITSNRSLYVDFTSPYTDMGFGAPELKKKRESMWTFFDPLDISLWLTSGAFFILTGFVVWLVERAVNPEFQGTWGQQLGMILWFGFSTLVLPHGEKLQKMSSRFLVIVWVFVVLILTSSYSANLTSTKTISRIQISQLVSPEKVEVYRRNILYNFEDNAQALRNGTISYVAAETPYLLVLLGQYPGVFNMLVKESGGNGFGFVCASLQNSKFLVRPHWFFPY
ncbi:hypothetical protein YC2023_051376 [Brassica napus]